MKAAKTILVIALTAVATLAAPLSSASAASGGLVAKRSGFVITPAMMQAINVIVAEEMKMRHHRR